MATYYSNSSNQREATPAMYIRDHGCTSYPETQVLPSNMIMYLNQSSSATSYPGGFTGNLPSIGASDSTPSQQGMGSSLISSNVGGQGYGVWRDRRNEMSFMQPMGGSANIQSDLCRDDEISQSIQIRFSEYLPPVSQGGNQNVMKGEVLGNLQSSTDPKSMSTLPNSKYLKVAQQLLDEVVNVRKALKRQDSDKKVSGETDGESKDGNVPPTTAMAPNTEESETSPTAEPSPAERQDLQNKVAKLLSMLDEVDRRYKQYYHQMQILVSSFDVIAGNGASKPYTTLALQTISRHFRCLRDSITAQIKAIRTNLGEQDTVGNNTKGGISRLRFVDQQLRQQRALQHLGMMQQHAWRPQRGLPESSVSILRAWLFEHFLHPYPKDSEKITLARQTGLTRGQVANWFINARVRLWKPMIEDMYKEEFGETQLESNSSSENAPKAAKDAIVVPNEKEEELQQNIHSASTEQFYPGQSQELKFEVTHDAEVSRPTAGDFFQANRHEVETTNYAQTDMVSCSLPQDTLVHADGSGDGRFMDAATAYQMSELGRFGSHGGVSLTLGLQHFDNGGVPMSDAARENYVAMRGLDMYNAAAASVGPNAVDFNCIDPDNQRHSPSAVAGNINNKFMVPSVLQSPAPLSSNESMKAIKEEVLVQNARKWVDDISFGIKILEADRPFLWRFITDAEKYFSMFSLYEKDTTNS